VNGDSNGAICGTGSGARPNQPCRAGRRAGGSGRVGPTQLLADCAIPAFCVGGPGLLAIARAAGSACRAAHAALASRSTQEAGVNQQTRNLGHNRSPKVAAWLFLPRDERETVASSDANTSESHGNLYSLIYEDEAIKQFGCAGRVYPHRHCSISRTQDYASNRTKPARPAQPSTFTNCAG
jgi:hypothetical protein